MARWIWVSALAAGCLSGFVPTPVRSEACACSLTPAPFMTKQSFGTPDQALGFARTLSELYTVVESFPHGETSLMAKADLLKTIAADDPPALSVDPVKYHTINGKEAATMEVIAPLPDGGRVRKRFLAVDTGSNLIIAQFWTLESRWSAHLEAIDKMAASLTFDTPAIDMPYMDAPAIMAQNQPLIEARKAHPTKIKEDLAYADALIPPPTGGQWIATTYPAAVGPLAAYATKDRGDGTKRPGIIYVEGGFGGPSSAVIEAQPSHNDQSASAFQQAGFIVLVPSFRGESANPGRFEMFYGETEDMLSAIAHLKARPDVDPDRIYLVGHSSGGTHVLNAAVATDQFRAAFVLGGRADLAGVMAEGGYGGEPFDIADRTEVQLRSPIHWVSYLTKPVYYFEGTGEYLVDAATMAQHSPHMQAWVVPGGDHFTIQQPVKQLIAQQIVEDTALIPSFSFDERALAAAMQSAKFDQDRDAAASP